MADSVSGGREIGPCLPDGAALLEKPSPEKPSTVTIQNHL